MRGSLTAKPLAGRGGLALAGKICMALTIHAKIEEEIFYPAMRKSINDEDLLDEAEVEHASAKQLIAEIVSMSPKDHFFDAKVKVLGEYDAPCSRRARNVPRGAQERSRPKGPSCRTFPSQSRIKKSCLI
ncbi:hemerythrin domain-containing protein [Methylocystis sp. B8]|uniref:hemerythrin domain-containing protein n=1 Tax=Methylocystis sp. B8 TaxID=544938 RepID=UPI001FEE8AF9|nr:hemerythrin domain-containing protein [Methylocystis sp. B8]